MLTQLTKVLKVTILLNTLLEYIHSVNSTLLMLQFEQIWTDGTICHYVTAWKYILILIMYPNRLNPNTFGQFYTVLRLPAAWWSCELMGPFFRSCNCMCFSVKTYPGALNPQCKQVKVPLQQVPRLLRENYAALSSSISRYMKLHRRHIYRILRIALLLQSFHYQHRPHWKWNFFGT